MMLLKNLNYNTIAFYLSVLYVCFVYFSPAISNICLALCFFSFTIGLFKNQISFSILKSSLRLYLLVTIPFFLTLLSVLNSYDVIDSLSFLWMRVPIIALPLVLFIIKPLGQKEILISFYIYIIFTFCGTIVTFFNAIKVYSAYGLLLDPDLTREHITPIQHPYYGVFTVIAIVTIYFFKSLIKSNYLRILLMTFLSVGVVLSTSRTAILLLCIFLIYVIIRSFRNQNLLKFAIILALGTTVFISVYSTVFKSKVVNTVSYWDSPRAWLWNNSYKILKYSNHKIIGTGIGDFYRVKKNPRQFVHSQRGVYGYNPHNQYLEFLITNGFLGLAYALAMLCMLFQCYKSRMVYAFFVITIVSVFSITECIFNRQFGIQLYVFFVPISLILANQKLKITIINV